MSRWSDYDRSRAANRRWVRDVKRFLKSRSRAAADHVRSAAGSSDPGASHRGQSVRATGERGSHRSAPRPNVGTRFPGKE